MGPLRIDFISKRRKLKLRNLCWKAYFLILEMTVLCKIPVNFNFNCQTHVLAILITLCSCIHSKPIPSCFFLRALSLTVIVKPCVDYRNGARWIPSTYDEILLAASTAARSTRTPTSSSRSAPSSSRTTARRRSNSRRAPKRSAASIGPARWALCRHACTRGTRRLAVRGRLPCVHS